MNWIAQRGGEVILHLRLSDEFLDWLAARTRDPAVAQLDPYRNAVLDASAWLRVLREVRTQAIAERRRYHEAHSHLPRESAARAVVLDRLLARDLARDANHRSLDDLNAFFELAFDTELNVQFIGD